MGRRRAALAPVLALQAIVVVVAAIAASAAAGVGEEEKCGGCTPCVGADCPVPVLYPSPPPPALPPPPPPYYYYSPPPPPASSYPGAGGGSAYCPPPPGAYIQIGSTPPGKGPLYPQDPGFMPSTGSTTTTPRAGPVAVAAAFAALAGAWAFL